MSYDKIFSEKEYAEGTNIMKIWGAIAAYLAVQGLIVVAMLLMAFIGFAAVFTQWIMLGLGFSEEIA